MQGRLLESLRIVPAILPKDITGAVQNGDWVNVRNWKRVLTVIQQGAWAGGTPAVTFEQATDASGSGAKALSYSERWDATALTNDVPARTAVTSDTSNLANAANGLMLVEHHAQDLDVNNGFVWLRVNVASPGSNTDLLSAHYVLGSGAYSGKPSTLPTAIA